MSVKNDTYGIAGLQDKMLEILKYFITLCDELDLKYYLAYGTCLGALRHNGFIPWDDDMDVYMPRPDYEKLWNACGSKTLASKYKLCRTGREKNYHHRVMQLADLMTTSIQKRNANEDIEHGVYIDIIPLDARADTFFGKTVQIVNAIAFSIFNIQCVSEYNGGKLTPLVNLGTNLLLKLVRDPDKRYKLWKKAEKRMTKYPYSQAKELVVLTDSVYSLFRALPVSWFENREHAFEDTVANIPSCAEDYCAACYGDYMQLPPADKRVVRRNTVYIDLNNSYLNYKNIYYLTGKE